MSDLTINVKKEEVQFKTPERLIDRVQDVGEAKRLVKLQQKS